MNGATGKPIIIGNTYGYQLPNVDHNDQCATSCIAQAMAIDDDRVTLDVIVYSNRNGDFPPSAHNARIVACSYMLFPIDNTQTIQ